LRAVLHAEDKIATIPVKAIVEAATKCTGTIETVNVSRECRSDCGDHNRRQKSGAYEPMREVGGNFKNSERQEKR
jgi:hypothetical protein